MTSENSPESVAPRPTTQPSRPGGAATRTLERLFPVGTVRRLLSVVLTVVAFDQITKALILDSFSPGEIRQIVPGLFNLTLHYNPGVAFGMFADLEDATRILVLTCTTILALSLVFYFLVTDYRHDRVGQFGLSLVMGGAVGNIIDRMTIGEVVDFLDFYLQDYHWPAFNVADSAICIGVAILMVRSFWQPESSASAL